MKRAKKPLLIFVLVLLPVLLGGIATSCLGEKLPARCVLSEVPYVLQNKNYCGPAALTSILNYWGIKTDQPTVGKAIFDKSIQATNGADMMLYARGKNMVAYSWNSSIADLKEKLALGIPVIVLQDSSSTDRSGHYRIAVGYDDTTEVIYVNDPYDPETKELSCGKFESLWQRHGNWSLLVCSPERDAFKIELDEKNPVVHIDLAYIYYKKGDLESSERESRIALALEPSNYSAQSILSKAIVGARSKAEKSK